MEEVELQDMQNGKKGALESRLKKTKDMDFVSPTCSDCKRKNTSSYVGGHGEIGLWRCRCGHQYTRRIPI